jgi:hypothetical protein
MDVISVRPSTCFISETADRILIKFDIAASYYHAYACVVTMDGILDYRIYWPLIGRTTNNYNTIAISTLYSSLLHSLVSSVYYSLHYPFPRNGL